MTRNTSQYDQIGNEYSKNVNATKEYARFPTLLKMTGPVKGKNILDLGCGDGFFTRKLADLNPKSITGIDISETMINLAIEKETINPKGIKYHTGDALNLNLAEKFDIVTAVYLLDYAESEEKLYQMCSSIYKHLNRDGIMASITITPKLIPRNEFFLGWKIIHPLGKNYFSDGDPIKIVSDPCMGQEITINCFYWSKTTYEKCLEKTGFKNITWDYRLTVSENGLKIYPLQFWKEVEETTAGISLRAVKL